MKFDAVKHFFLFGLTVFLFSACNKYPMAIDYESVYGVTIGRENCKGTDTEDDWLIDLSVFPYNPSQYGDSVTYNGTFYAKVIKVKGLQVSLRPIGSKSVIDFKEITPYKVVSSGCTASNPATYPLREITILNQGAGSF